MGLEPRLEWMADLSERWGGGFREWGRFYFSLQLLTSFLP